MPTSLRFDPKNPFLSKTLWINGLTIIVACLSVVSGMTSNVPAEAMPYIVGALAIANVALRFVTRQALGFALLMLAGMLSLGCVGPTAFAGDIAIIVPSTPGNYLLAVDAAGSVVLSPLDKIVRPGTPTPPTPTPGPLTERATQIRDAAAKVTADPDRATTAHGLAELYRQIAKLVRTPGQVTDATTLANATRTATDTFLASRGSGAPAQWLPVRDVFSTQWTALTAKSGSLTDYAALLDEAASGLDASAPAKPGAGITIPPEMMDFIIKVLLPLILQLLMKQA